MNNLPSRKTPRLQGYDYAQGGAYFVTICTNEKKKLFGKIENNILIHNEWGKIAYTEIAATNELRKDAGIEITKYVVMPNHVHLIMEIVGTRRAVSEVRRYEGFSKPVAQSLSTVVRAYKSAVTKKINELGGHGAPCPYKVWQSRFHDHIIRNEKEYQKIWEYIENNPVRWEKDCFYCF